MHRTRENNKSTKWKTSDAMQQFNRSAKIDHVSELKCGTLTTRIVGSENCKNQTRKGSAGAVKCPLEDRKHRLCDRAGAVTRHRKVCGCSGFETDHWTIEGQIGDVR